MGRDKTGKEAHLSHAGPRLRRVFARESDLAQRARRDANELEHAARGAEGSHNRSIPGGSWRLRSGGGVAAGVQRKRDKSQSERACRRVQRI